MIGAGCAGLATAVKLAAAGKRVVVAEEAPRLGGRTTAFTDRESGERVDNGQHVLFGCYHATYELLRQIGAEDRAPLQQSLSVVMSGPDGRAFQLRCPNLPSPWHVLAGVLTWPALPLRDRISVVGLRRLLSRVRRDGAIAAAAEIDPQITVEAWLSAERQSPRLIEWLWEPLVLAALNQSAREAAAAPFVRVLCDMFGPGEANSSIGLPRVPLDDLFAEPAKRFIESRGGLVLTRSPARVVTTTDAVQAVRVGETTIGCDTVVSSVPWHALARLWDGGPPTRLAALVERASAMRSMPIVTVNLWFDRPIFDAGGVPFVGHVGGTMQWFFDKSAIFGQAASHIAAVTSGASELLTHDTQEIVALAEHDARVVFPHAREARLLRSVVVREPRATFALAPGGPARPSTVTELRGFYLAGDWTDTGLPGTIEGAIQSGFRAATCILAANH